MIVFIITLLVIYANFMFFFKMNTDLEYFHMGLPPNAELNRVCNYKQPVLFDTAIPCTVTNAEQTHTLHIHDGESVHLPSEDALTLFRAGVYGSFDNTPPTAFMPQYANMNRSLQPALSTPLYDFMLGTDSYVSPYRQIRTHRAFFMVTHGSVTVKCSPHKRDPLEIRVHTGQVLYIPTFWWHTIQLHKEAFVCIVYYDNVFNKMVAKLR
jgi:hypothetical protein